MIIDNPHKLTTLGTPVEGKQKKYMQINTNNVNKT
jgi:hypothetical protein